jgi:hypothetical protein
MKPHRLRLGKILILFCLFVSAMHLLPASTVSVTAGNWGDQGRLLPKNQLRLAQLRDCSRRAGPFATQTTAWQRLRQTESQGYGVSGVFPCYDGYGSRGYCFNVFVPC